jgi:hypothetical protein
MWLAHSKRNLVRNMDIDIVNYPINDATSILSFPSLLRRSTIDTSKGKHDSELHLAIVAFIFSHHVRLDEINPFTGVN